MARHHTTSYPRRFVEPVLGRDGEETTPGYWIEMYQENTPYTPEEELARDVEERDTAIRVAAREERKALIVGLTAKLVDDSITEGEMRELMRLERGL